MLRVDARCEETFSAVFCVSLWYHVHLLMLPDMGTLKVWFGFLRSSEGLHSMMLFRSTFGC